MLTTVLLPLSLLSARSCPTPVCCFPPKIGAANAVEVNTRQWVVLVLQVLQVQCGETSQKRGGVPRVSGAEAAICQEQRCYVLLQSHPLALFSFPTLVSVCAPLHLVSLLFFFFFFCSLCGSASSSSLPPPSPFLSSPPSASPASLCGSVHSLVVSVEDKTVHWWSDGGRCGLLSFNDHSVEVCLWSILSNTNSLWFAYLQIKITLHEHCLDFAYDVSFNAVELCNL